MKYLKKIITGVTIVVALTGYSLIHGSLISYAKVNAFELETVLSKGAVDSEACVSSVDNPLQINECRKGELIPPANNSSEKGRSILNNSASIYLTEEDEGLSRGSSRVDWSQNVATVVLTSQGNASVLSKIRMESGSDGQSDHYEQAEFDSTTENVISGSLLVSILALIAIVAVARRNVSEL